MAVSLILAHTSRSTDAVSVIVEEALALADDLGIGFAHHFAPLIRVVERRKHDANGLEAGAALIVGANDQSKGNPWCA